MKYDLIALDLDGTALNPHNTVSPAVREAVAWARSCGVHVVISTGRICSEAAEFAQMMGANDEMVTSGGATLSSVSKGGCTTVSYTHLDVYKRQAIDGTRRDLSGQPDRDILPEVAVV